MLPARRPSWLADEDGGVNVLVPGLMGAGILASFAMLVSDALRRVFLSLGGRAWAARLAVRAAGRVRDLESVRHGLAPVPAAVDRVPRGRLASLVLATVALAAAATILSTTVAVYRAGGEGALGRPLWNLSGGILLGSALAAAAAVWAAAAITGPGHAGWVRAASRWWPLGALPADPEPHLRHGGKGE